MAEGLDEDPIERLLPHGPGGDKPEKKHDDDPHKWSRRAFLGASAVSGVSLGAAGFEALTQGHDETAEHGAEHGAEHAHDLPLWLDLSTAGIVCGEFVRNVFYEGAMKGNDLGFGSAAEMNGLAQARIAALKLWGGEEGTELAKEEQHEVIHGLQPVPLLVALSDATSEALKANADEVFASVTKSFECGFDYKNVKRPELSDQPDVWKNYLDKVNADLTTRSAQIAAVTSVLAPFGTTYASSSLANNLKEDIARMLYEQSFALAVLEHAADESVELEGGASELRGRIHTAAVERADQFMNGYFGFSKLMTTLSANTQGSWGIGDPPEIYFFLNHKKDLKTLALGHAIGAANSEVYTILTNFIWLARIGNFDRKFFMQFLRNQYKTAKAMLTSIENGDLRDISFGEGKNYASAVADVLSGDPDSEEDVDQVAKNLKDVFDGIGKAKFQFPIRSYLQEKLRILKGLESRVDELIELGVTSDEVSFSSSNEFKRMATSVLNGERAGGKDLKAFEQALQQSSASGLANLFTGFVEEQAVLDRPLDREQLDNDEYVEEHVKAAREAKSHQRIIVQRLMNNVRSVSNEEQAARLVQARDLIGAEGDVNGSDLYDVLSRADDDTIDRALGIFTSISDIEDVVEGEDVGGNHKPGESVSEATSHTHAEHTKAFLNHSAREVLWALLTQIPSVPAICRMAKLSIPVLAASITNATGGEVRENEVTTDQLKATIAVTIPVEAGLSSSADNVAAYLFAENVLTSFFKDTFGPEIFKRRPSLAGKIGIVAVKVAENAGSLYKLGNGPNFTQDRLDYVTDQNNVQGISLNRRPIPNGETMSNGFAHFVNSTFVVGAIAYLNSLVDDVAESEGLATNDVNIGRRGFFDLLKSMVA